MLATINHKGSRLFLILGCFFVANALIAECIGVKIFSLEQTFGANPVDWTVFGVSGLSFNLTAGVLLWPLVFVMTDIINEYFGPKGVWLLSSIAAVLIAYAFVMFFAAVYLPAADFWVGVNQQKGVPNMQNAFSAVFGQGMWIIVGSLVAFLVGQVVDVLIFHRIKFLTGENRIWLRATGSTLVSQLIDSFVVLFIAFYIGGGWDLATVLAIGVVNYCYKFVVAVLMTPVIYAVHHRIDRYLGPGLSSEMRKAAMKQRMDAVTA
jgi:queuosine precursor transporter